MALRPARFTPDEVRIFPLHGEVNLWYVHGDPGTYYPTKIAAEAAARILYPDEVDRYCRIYYHRFEKER